MWYVYSSAKSIKYAIFELSFKLRRWIYQTSDFTWLFRFPSISLFIVCVFYYISRSQIIDLTIGPKAFVKRLKIASLLLSSLRTKKDLDDFNRQLQLLKYTEAMQKHRNNYNAAADELKVHPTTLRNALKN